MLQLVSVSVCTFHRYNLETESNYFEAARSITTYFLPRTFPNVMLLGPDILMSVRLDLISRVL